MLLAALPVEEAEAAEAEEEPVELPDALEEPGNKVSTKQVELI